MNRSRVVADAGCVLAVVLAVLAVGFGWASELSRHDLTEGFVVSNTVLGLSLSLAGYPIARARPGNAVGWLLLAAGLTYQLSGTGYAVLAWATDPGDTSGGWRLFATFVNGGWPLSVTVFIPCALLLFPDGRPISPVWRYAVVAAAVTGSLFAAAVVTAEKSTVSDLGIDGYGRWPALSRQDWLRVPVAVFGYLLLGLALAGLVVRYRRGGDRERRQVLWLLFAGILMVAVFLISDVVGLDSWASIYVIALVPLAILVAVLRHQLLDIRLVVSRSLVYGALTALVVVAYVGIVTVTDRNLSDRVPLGPPVIAAMVVALAFNPARQHLQRWVDRLLYGARNDPVRAVAEVGARLGDSDELDGVLRSLCQVLRLPGGAIVTEGVQVASYGDAGPSTTLPLQDVGELVVTRRVGERRLDPADERVLKLLTGPIGTAVRLRAARNALVAAREEERRRLRRDLHDGIGPALTGVILQADAARRIAETDPKEAARLMDEVRKRTTETVNDIRRLVNELRPPELDVLGLSGAIREHAATLRQRVDGTPLSVTVDAGPLPDLPAGVEVAIYRIAVEALHNISRHSTATLATVRLEKEGPNLCLQIHDNGPSTNGAWRPGVGLTSMKERVAEMSGTLVVGPSVAGGIVQVTVPTGAA